MRQGPFAPEQFAAELGFKGTNGAGQGRLRMMGWTAPDGIYVPNWWM
jgi:hypothetical protein